MTTTTITKPGVYRLDEAAYHADPCAKPSLSSTIANVLLKRSPRHAWHAHPRLNPGFEAKESQQFDLGSAAHALMLKGRNAVIVVDADDWRTKDARKMRDEARAAGRIPLLPQQWADVQAMTDAATAQLEAHHDEAVRRAFALSSGGRSELTLIWREGAAWYRARPDWLPSAGMGEIVYDYKTTAGSAHPDGWTQAHLFRGSAAIQAAFYCRGARAVVGWRSPRFLFVVQEQVAPYALSVIEMSPAAMALADRQVEAALDLWRACIATDRWPGYPARVATVDAPGYIDFAWCEREAREETLRAEGATVFSTLADWQAPIPKESAT